METDREELVSDTVQGRRTILKGALGAAAVAAGGGLLSACSGGSSTSSASGIPNQTDVFLVNNSGAARASWIQADGYCRRRPNPDDRRSSLLVLTPAGRKVLDAAGKAIDDELVRRLGGLSPRAVGSCSRC
jgi:hypothetical protein